MKDCYHIWDGATQSSLFIIQRRLCVLFGNGLFSSLQPLYHRQNVTIFSLLYRYFNGQYSDELDSLLSPILTILATTNPTTLRWTTLILLICVILNLLVETRESSHLFAIFSVIIVDQRMGIDAMVKCFVGILVGLCFQSSYTGIFNRLIC